MSHSIDLYCEGALVSRAQPLPVGAKIVDSTGVNQGLIFNAGSPQICSQPYLQALAEGDIPNHEVFTKNGYNGALSSTEQTLWAVGGDYVVPSSAMQMEVVSSDVNDTGAGTGAQSVEIHYLDNTYAEKSEIITLSGTVAVPTVATNILRINTFRVKTVGTGGKNAGNIDVRNLADTPIYSRIAIGINRAINCTYTVPAGKALYICNLLFSAGSNVANRPVKFITKATYDNISKTVVNFYIPYTNVIITDGSVDVPIECPTKFPATTNIKINAVSPDGASYGACTIRGWVELA